MNIGIQQSQNSQGALGSVIEQLRQREVSRISKGESEKITYDTGQQIQRTLKTIEAPGNVQKISGQQTAQIIETIVEDSRTGYFSKSIAGGGSAYMSGERDGYPELQKLFEPLESMRRSSLSLDTPAIFHVPAVFLGHGNIPPWALLHPVVIAQVVLGTILPFKREEGFSMRKAEAYFRKQGQLVEAARINSSYDDFVACVRPDPLMKIGCPTGMPCGIELLVFNPKLLAETKKQDPHNRSVAEVPSADRTLFRVDCLIARPGSKIDFGMSAYQYSQNKFDAVHPIDLQGIESERAEGFYIKIDRAVVEQLVRLAPLPIEQSDCGASLGYPEINRQYANLRMSAHARSEVIRQLKKETSSLVAALNSDSGWQALPEQGGAGEVSVARPLLVRTVFHKGSQGDSSGFEVERQAKEIAPDEIDLARRFIELNDRERELLGLKDAARTLLELKVC